MISRDHLEIALYEAMVKAATQLPPDVERCLHRALEEETDPLAREH